MRMRRDFEALERSEAAAAAMAEAREWERVVAEAVAGREKYRGVRKVPSGQYVAAIQENGEQVWLGTYNAALLAACAYDLAVRSLQGHRARPNFAYPPPPGLVSAVAATPRRRPHSYSAPFLAYPSSHMPRPARARLVLRAPETETTVVRSIPLESFSFQAAAAGSRPVYDAVNLVAPPMHMVAPASSVKTCFSSTVDPDLRDSASSSSGPRRPLMLKKLKVTAIHTTTTTTTTTPTNADCEVTGDNFTIVAVPSLLKVPSYSQMPIDHLDGAL